MSIQQFRDKTEGMIAKIIVGLIIIVFALFGMGSITTFLAPVPKVATVNGEIVSQQDMELAVERNRRILLAQQVSPSDIDDDELRSRALEQLVLRELLRQRKEDWGLYYSDAELDAEIVATDTFKEDGVFSPQRFQMVLAGAGFTPMRYREEMRTDKITQQIVSAIGRTAFETETNVTRANSLAQQTRDIAYLVLPLEDRLSQVVVDEDEVAAYYDNNRTAFFAPEMFNIEYVEVRRSDLEDAVEVTPADLEQFYAETRGDYTQDESRRVAHILIETNDDVSEEDAKVIVDEVYGRITDGEDFAALAEEYSDDPGSAETGGDLGFTERGAFVEEFEDVAYSLVAADEVAPPVLTMFGWHIIKLLEVSPATTPELSEISDLVERAYRERESEDQFIILSSDLDEIAFEAPDLVAPAEELGLELRSTGLVNRDSTDGILANRRVMEAATSPDVLVDGNNSSVIEIAPDHHLVVRVAEYQEAAQKPLADVDAEIRGLLMAEKAADLLEEQAEGIVAELEAGAITRYVADQAGVEWEVVAEAQRYQPEPGQEILLRAFSLPKPGVDQKSVGYTTLASGDVAVISVTNVQNRAPTALPEIEQQELLRRLAMLQGQLDYQAFERSLTETADVSQSL